MPHIELNRLRAFVTVAELGQLTRAAEALHVSQPAITAQIRALEDEIELSLFERTPTGMVLTRAGQQLLPRAHEILAAVQVFVHEAEAMVGRIAGKVNVGTVSDPELIRLGELLSTMTERFPLIEIGLQQKVSGTALEQVRDGVLDASFYFGDITHPSVSGLRLRRVVYRVAGPAEWSDRINGADWSGIAALPWIRAPLHSTYNTLLNELFHNQGAEPGRVVEADQEPVIRSLVASGVGMSLMREDQALAAVAEGEAVIWGHARACTDLWFIFPADEAASPAIHALVDVLREIWELPVAAPGRAPAAGGGFT